MKKFNQMTEAQMSKTNGGIVGTFFAAWLIAAFAMTVGTVSQTAKRK